MRRDHPWGRCCARVSAATVGLAVTAPATLTDTAAARTVNSVADAIADEFPHVVVDTLAYQYTRPAPNITVPRKNVVIRLCSIECNFAAPLVRLTACLLALSRGPA